MPVQRSQPFQSARRMIGVAALLFSLALLCPAAANGQVIPGEVVVGSRVFGPSPCTPIVGGTFTVGFNGFFNGGFYGNGFGPALIGYGYRPYYAYGWPYFGYGYYRPWAYGGGYGWPYGYGGWYRPYFRPAPLVLPPVVIPSEQIFGPAAAARMLGVDLFGPVPAQVAPAQVAPAQVAPAQAAPAQDAPAEVGAVAPERFVPLAPEVIARRAELARAKRDEKPPFVSNAAARQRAARFMELGDAYFAQARYVLAYERYKSAVQAAPDLVEPYLRRGQALIAMRSYDLAALTYQHAFKMHPDWAKTAFRLDTLYANRPHDKEDHLDALAAAAEKEPTAELMFLLGAQLLYDGQAERSLKFFQRAKDLPHREELPLRGIAERAEKAGDKKPPLEVQPAAAPQPAGKKPRGNDPAIF